jgi:hypothetical protein
MRAVGGTARHTMAVSRKSPPMDQRAPDPDAPLVAAMARGEEQAFATLYRRYLALVLRWVLAQRRGTGARRHYLMNSISEYFGSGQRSSATSFSRRSATSRTSSIAPITESRR